jgi:hypothetical protein
MAWRAVHVQVGHHGDLDAAAGAAADFFLVALQHVEGAAADGADAQQAYLDRFHGEFTSKNGRSALSISASSYGVLFRCRALAVRFPGSLATRPMASRRSSSCGRNTMRKWSVAAS